MRKSLTIFLFAVLFLAAGIAEAGWEEGVAAFKAGNLDTAAQEFRGVVEKNPEFSAGHFMLGQVLLKQKKNREALESLRKAYELDSEQVSYQMALSQAYLGNNRFSDAAQLLRRINVGSLPKSQQTIYYQMLGVALQQSGDDSGALDALKRVADASPNDSDAWYRYGTVAFNLGQTDNAVSALEKAVNLDGNDPDKRKAYAQALVRKARLTRGDGKRQVYARATVVADTLAKQQPTYDNLLFLGEVQLGAARYQDAVNTLRQAASKTSSDWHPHFYLSQAYTQLDQWDAVASAAQTALDRAQDAETRKRVWSQIGFAFEKQKRFDQSIDAYRKAGDQAGVDRVSENKRIASENEQIEEENARIKAMEEERKRLEEELRDLGGPPRR